MTGRTIFISLALVCMAAAVLFAGCTTPGGSVPSTPVPTTPVPATTQPPAGTGSFDQSNDGGTYPISRGAEIELRLPENPTTGFSWNLSLSTGLSLINDSYIPSDTTGKLVGSGGTHVWFLSANLPGGQTVSGTYRRPWEPAGPGVTFFTLNLIVEEGSCGPNVCTLPTTPSTVPPAYPVYTEADTGKAVQESRGGTFAIRLPENPSTGYSWNLSLPAGITLARDEYIPPQTAGQTVGRGGTRSFTLVADKTGTGNITTEYRRPWVPAGTVTRVNLEGGFFGILGDDGKKYEPQNLDTRYQVDGLRVAFEATAATGTVSMRMWGTPVTLDSIETIHGFSLRVTVK